MYNEIKSNSSASAQQLNVGRGDITVGHNDTTQLNREQNLTV